jgi:hypothetical protein
VRGLIARISQTHRYQLTETGLRTALFYTCSLSQVIRPMHAALNDSTDPLQQRILRVIRPLAKTACEMNTAA